MSHSLFEGHYLINLIGGIIRQNNIYPTHSHKVNWERVYRLADYHKVANIAYLGLLGASEEMDQDWKECFFRRYQQALFYNGIYESAEADVLGILDVNRIPCTVLASSSVREFYAIPETAGNAALQLLIEGEGYIPARNFLIDHGYESTEFYGDYGEHMENAAGFCVDLFRQLPFETDTFQSTMKKLLEGSYPDPHFHGINGLSMEYGFIYCMAVTVYQYCRDRLTIRRLLDTYLMYCGYRDEMDNALVQDWFRRMEIDQITVALLHIAAMWFGSRDDDLINAPKDSFQTYDEIEARILSNGLSTSEHEIVQVLQVRDQIHKYREKKAKAEEKRKRKEERKASVAERKGAGFWRRLILRSREEQNHAEDMENAAVRGEVSVTEMGFGILAVSRFFEFTLPFSWRDRYFVWEEQITEDFSNSDLKVEERNPYTYQVRLLVRALSGMPIPFLTFKIFDEGLNAAMVSREENGYYIGKLFHMDAENEYDCHLTVTFDHAVPEDEDLDIYEELLQSRKKIITSIAPVNDPEEQNVNLLERFENWETEEMPFSFR